MSCRPVHMLQPFKLLLVQATGVFILFPSHILFALRHAFKRFNVCRFIFVSALLLLLFFLYEKT